MGGSAFSASLSSTTFPRIPPAVYRNLRAKLLLKMQELYTYVGVPMEAPEKADHGDLDFLVAVPIATGTDYVPHEQIVETIGAKYVVPQKGNRTSNFALPIKRQEWQETGHGAEEDERRTLAEGHEIFYQVDVHVCADKGEWDRTMFFHSYGDLGMIIGLIARNNGLKLGVHGLKLPDIPNPPFLLSDSFEDITSFLGLSMETYRNGFQTRREVFQWAASCKYFDHSRFQTRGEGITKVRQDRRMYAEFVDWVEESRPLLAESCLELNPYLPRGERFAKAREDALLFFDKRDAFDAIIKDRTSRQRLKAFFNGSVIRHWAELSEADWEGVKLISDEVKRRVGGDVGLMGLLESDDQDQLEDLVHQVKDDFNIVTMMHRSLKVKNSAT